MKERLPEMSADSVSSPPNKETVRPPPMPGIRLLSANRELVLDHGTLVVGRGANCDLVIDDSLASRKHAVFTLTEEGLIVEDLGSVNGVYVNGKRVDKQKRLVNGDRVLIGREIVEVFGVPDPNATSPETESPDTSGEKPALVSNAPGPIRRESGSMPTIRPPITTITDNSSVGQSPTVPGPHETFEVIRQLVDKMLALGRTDEAEKILMGALPALLRYIRNGTKVPAETCDLAVRYASVMADLTAKAFWVDFAVELFSEEPVRPWPASVIDTYFQAVRKINAVDLVKLRKYLSLLQKQLSLYTPNDLFLVQRIEGFERLVSRK